MTLTSDATALIQRRDRAFGAGARLFYDEPLHLVRGEGCHVFDAEGRRYVDMYNNVPCVGHAHPRVVEAMAHQQATLNTHNRYLHEGAIVLAERLTALQGVTECVVFSCSGTEAVENALRMARFATGARGIICTNATYHGSNAWVGGLTRVGEHGPSDPDARAIPFPEILRPITPGLSGEALTGAYLARLDAAIDDLKQSGSGFAALILCSILANEGLPNLPPDFMASAAQRVRAAGGLMIADEVQAGYGRTGQWWGYDATGFIPDIVVTGKPMGAGLPLAATAASRAVVERFRAETRYFNTFASSPLQAAVGLAVLDIIEQEGLIDNVALVGKALKKALAERKPAWDAIIDVRGTGLFLGIELVDKTGAPSADLAFDMVCRLRRKGFLVSNAGIFGNVVKIRPPLVFSMADGEAFLDAFDQVVADQRG
jgi:4-aminobutyrate aminotransferase-like enzyme